MAPPKRRRVRLKPAAVSSPSWLAASQDRMPGVPARGCVVASWQTVRFVDAPAAEEAPV